MARQAGDRNVLAALSAALLGLALAVGPAWGQTTPTAPSPNAPVTAPKPAEPSKPAETPKPADTKPADVSKPVEPAKPTAAPASPTVATPPSATPPSPAPAPAPQATPEGVPLAPKGKPQVNEIEPNASPTTPDKATTENVDVPARAVIAQAGQSSYDDAFKTIKASIEAARKTMDKAGVAPTGHPITIFSAPDDKGFKYQAGFPVAQMPAKTDLGDGVVAILSPSGKAIKFQHRGAYEDIDSTYDVITAFLDAKGLQVDSPYIEEYLTDLTTSDDPNLQVDIYVFVK